MRIGIDARFFGPIGKGLGRYTEKLIEHLEAIDQENKYFIFLRQANFDDYEPKNNNFEKVLADYRWYSLMEQIRFPYLLKKYNLDLVHFPHFNVPLLYFGKFIVTIHDLILLHFPTIRSSTLSPLIFWVKFLLYRVVIKSAIMRSSRIIAVSQFTKEDILKNYKKVLPEKIIVTYEACEGTFLQSPYNDEKILSRYDIIKPYIIYVGNAYPHKNLERLVLAFRKVVEKKSDLKLLLVGNEDYFYRRLKNFVKEKGIENIIFAGYVPDHDLDTIYANAEIFIWPSLYEGFGLPPLEAMAKEIPVVSSDHSCMKEILGENAYYFNGRKKEEIFKAIIKVVGDEELKRKLVIGGRNQVKKYNWKVMAEKTLQLYKNFLKE